MTFLNETLEAIKDSGHSPEDIIYIGSTAGDVGYETDWDTFQLLAGFEYDSGYGASHIPTDLRIVFSDGSDLHRGEYDGSEWWEFSKPFVRPGDTKPIRNLNGNDHLWPSVADLQEVQDEQS